MSQWPRLLSYHVTDTDTPLYHVTDFELENLDEGG